ncbi:hypothetical protein [Sinosporangium siamense]|uniref:Uncharacterized protein n=1 Tax=Sinosporangium siamense TaxID=1367973 RepID=A0A919RI01_9ACTN|nr:hypothetical protein [Sinosporangium siamense]GII93657.1 hypothetical protein Ssi02_38880 [Sinosporangium siamense]
MRASIATYYLHKGGCAAEEYEDAFAVCPELSQAGVPDVAKVRLAIADGASESVLAGAWARLLGKHFTLNVPGVFEQPLTFARHTVSATESFESALYDYVAERAAHGRPLRWYEQRKLDRGAYATLLAVGFFNPYEGDVLAPTDDRGWTAAAIGDSGFFQVRDGRLLVAFPMVRSAEFSTSPGLLNSRNRDVHLVAQHVRMRAGDVRPHDDIYLCTDAVAAWFLAEAERGGHPWKILNDLRSEGGPHFTDLITEERAAGRMRNDDATLIHVAVR